MAIHTSFISHACRYAYRHACRYGFLLGIAFSFAIFSQADQLAFSQTAEPNEFLNDLGSKADLLSEQYGSDEFTAQSVVITVGLDEDSKLRAFRGINRVAENQFEFATEESLEEQVTKYVEDELAANPELNSILIRGEGNVQTGYIELIKRGVSASAASKSRKLFVGVVDPQFQSSPLAEKFLTAISSLTPVQPRTVFRRRSPRSVLLPSEFEKLDAAEQGGYSDVECDEQLYYGYYSTPLAWTRPLDRLGREGVDSFDGLRIIDFGFGNVAQLRMMASLGANVTGIEIDESLQSKMYREDSDQGEVPRLSDSIKNQGTMKLVFGQWPANQDVLEQVGGGYDLFVTKNVLKLGYIHPERKAPASQLIDLGVDDAAFLKRVWETLNPGGLLLVYNIHPPKSGDDEVYKTWAYGETPWDRELVEQAGFEVLHWHVDDSKGIHALGRVLGWDESFDSDKEFQANFRAMFTILRKN